MDLCGLADSMGERLNRMWNQYSGRCGQKAVFSNQITSPAVFV